MVYSIDGKPPSAEDLKAYADKIEEKLYRMAREDAEVDKPFEVHNENAIKLLSIQQQRMADDIREINSALKSVASSLSNLAVLEQKHNDAMEAIKRGHKRIDDLSEDFNKHKEKFEEKLNGIIVHQAKNVWIERLLMAAAIGAVSVWINRGGI